MRENSKRNVFGDAYRRLTNAVALLEERFITILTLMFGLMIVYNVVLRAFHIQGLTWIEEFSRYMLVVTTLMGCSIAVRHQGHMVMDTIVTAFPTQIGHATRAVGYMVCSAMYLYLGYYGFKWTGKLISMNKKTECINFPLWPVWVFVTYAVLTMGCRYAAQFIKSIGAAVRGDLIISEQDAQIASAIAEEQDRQKLQK